MSASLSDAYILLTGSEGFTGHYLKKILEQEGARVVTLKSDLTESISLSLELESLRIDYVVHLAAISFVPHGTDMDVYAINLFGTQNLLEALKTTQKSLKKVILASTANVYGNTQSLSISEFDCPQPISHYAISKLSMEYMAAQYTEDFPILITRPFNYTGVGQEKHFLIPKIISHFQAFAPSIELGNIDVFRDFSDVRWVTQVYRELLLSPLNSGTFNLCSGSIHSLRDIIEHLSRLNDHQISIEVNPLFVRPNEIKILKGDNTKLYNALPNLIPPIPFKETLRWMLETRK